MHTTAKTCEEGLKMTVTSIRDAWAEVRKIFPTDYEYSTERSERAGYLTARQAV